MEIYWRIISPLQKQVGLLEYPKPVSHVVVEEKERVLQDFFGNIKINQKDGESRLFSF